MRKPKMNPDEIDIDCPVVVRLIARQFPQWAGLPITAVHSAGTDNAIFRLGDDMAVRLPRRPAVVASAAVHHYRVSNPVMAAAGERAISQVIADYQRTA